MNALCGAKTRDGSPCRLPPLTGATRCRMHGGASPASRAKAEERQLRATLNRDIVAMGYEPVTNPALLLADIAGEAVAFKNLAREQMNTLDTWESHNRIGTEAVKARVAIYTQALRDVANIADKMWSRGLDHTALQLEATRPTRDQAETLSRAIDRALDLAQFDQDDRARLMAALAQAFVDEGLVSAP